MKEVFIKYLENNQNIIQKIFFENILNELKSKEQFDLLEKIVLYYPNWDFINLNIDFFDDKYINCYGVEFLAKNIKNLDLKYLEYGIKDHDIKKRIILIDKLNIPFDNINSKLLLNTVITDNNIKFISKFLKDKTLSNFICNNFIDNKEDFDIILKATNENSNYYKLINILLNKFKQSEYHKIKNILFENNIEDYINFFENIEISWFNIDNNIEKYLNIFKNNKNLFNEIKNNKNNKNIKSNLKIYFYDNTFNINSIKDLNNIRILRYEKFKEKINNSNNIEEIKNLITNCYFNLEYKTFQNKISQIKNTIIEGLKLKKDDMYIFRLFQYLCNSHDINTIVNLFNNLINIPFIYEYMNRIENKQKEYCFKDITNSLTNVGNGCEIIEFDGQDFNFLIHKIKGYANHDLANQLYDDPSLWDKNYVNGSYISASVITNDYFGCVPGSGYILAFNNIDALYITDMGCEDIFSSIITNKNNIKHNNSSIMTFKNLIKNSNKLYNEILLKRYKNNKSIIPSAVVVFDKVTQKDISVAKYFNVPIYLINREKYLSKMICKCNEYINAGDYENYCNYRMKLAVSFNDNQEIMQKYFNIDKLTENTNFIIDKITNQLKKAKNNSERSYLKKSLQDMIKTNYRINSIMMYNDITYKNYEFDNNNIEKKLNINLKFNN